MIRPCLSFCQVTHLFTSLRLSAASLGFLFRSDSSAPGYPSGSQPGAGISVQNAAAPNTCMMLVGLEERTTAPVRSRTIMRLSLLQPSRGPMFNRTPRLEKLERLWRSGHIHNGVTRLVQKAKAEFRSRSITLLLICLSNTRDELFTVTNLEKQGIARG